MRLAANPGRSTPSRSLRLLLLLAVLVAATAVTSAPAEAKRKPKAKVVKITAPTQNDMSVARLSIRVRSRAKASAAAKTKLPKLKVKNASGLPQSLKAVAAVARGKKKNTFVAFVVLANAGSLPPSASAASPPRAAGDGETTVKTEVTAYDSLGRAVGTRATVKTSQAPDIITTTATPELCYDLLGQVTFARSYSILGSVMDTSELVDAAMRRCQDKPAFSLNLTNSSWTHGRPTANETIVCVDASTDPPQPSAANRAFLSRDTGLGFGSVAMGDGALGANGAQTVSFAIQEAGTYRIALYVQTSSGIVISAHTDIQVPPPPTPGPRDCP